MPGAAEVGDPIAVLPVLFHLLWRHILTADLAARLTGGTVVGPGRPGPAEHAGPSRRRPDRGRPQQPR